MTRVKKLEIMWSLQKALASLRRARAFCDSSATKKQINNHVAKIERMVEDLRTTRAE